MAMPYPKITMFFIGTNRKIATTKLKEVEKILRLNFPDFDTDMVVSRSPDEVFFMPSPTAGQAGVCNIRIKLLMVRNVWDVLAQSAPDPTAIALMNDDLWISPRALRAFYTGYTRLEGTLTNGRVLELLECAILGFGVNVPVTALPNQGRQAQCGDMVNSLKVFSMHQTRITYLIEHEYELPFSALQDPDWKKIIPALTLSCEREWTQSASGLANMALCWQKAAGSPMREADLIKAIKQSSLLGGFCHDWQAFEWADDEPCYNAAFVSMVRSTWAAQRSRLRPDVKMVEDGARS
ncbi:hypothetical protein CF326_g8490 [Tilletia indica]|nr:hypothetical protein CF326_g8490 [Tilletia indica]